MSRIAGEDWLNKTLVMQASLEREKDTLFALGFHPAFYDYARGAIYLSRKANGSPSIDHCVDGLPDEAVAVRSSCGRVIAARATLLAGFARDGYFYTRSAAWRAAEEWGCAA